MSEILRFRMGSGKILKGAFRQATGTFSGAFGMRVFGALALAFALSMCSQWVLTPAFAQLDVAITVDVTPPPLPIYDQPLIPAPGYLWVPGYWAWDDDVGYFSNRPVGVKHFQAIHRFSVNVAHGLVLLFGIGTKALPSWDPRTRRNNLLGGLAVTRTAGSSEQANSPHPSSREGHLSTAGWNSSFLLSDLIRCGCHAATAACSRVQRNSVPSTQMRCMITANRRASATIAFFIPRRLAICIAQALSQDHFLERIMA